MQVTFGRRARIPFLRGLRIIDIFARYHFQSVFACLEETFLTNSAFEARKTNLHMKLQDISSKHHPALLKCSYYVSCAGKFHKA